jgi:hypothetical protein
VHGKVLLAYAYGPPGMCCYFVHWSGLGEIFASCKCIWLCLVVCGVLFVFLDLQEALREKSYQLQMLLIHTCMVSART